MNDGFAYRRESGDAMFGLDGKIGGKSKWILGAVIGALFVWGIPILSNPSAASAILFHGHVVQIGIAMLAVWATAVVARRWSANVDTSNPMSRFVFFVKFSALFCGGLFLLVVIWLRSQEHTEIKIQLHGQRAMADVVRIYTGSCGRRSCSVNVEYVFTPTSKTGEPSQPTHGYAQLSTNNRSNDPDVVYARTQHHVPIAYEVDHPQWSALNFNDDIFRLDHGQKYRSALGLFAKIFLGVFLLLVGVGGVGAVGVRRSRRRSDFC
jgi:hypothetical protein